MAHEPRNSISFPVVKVRQPIGEFYIGVISWRDLCNIADFDVRRIIRERDVETYLGIQRPLSKKRVSELQKYVNTGDATFPTSVILAVDGRCASIAEDGRTMTLTNYMEVEEWETPLYFKNVAKVLDGQHRIAGLWEFRGERSDFDLNVTIFVDVDIADQANIFSTVNLAQTKVNRSLAYDLYALAKTRSPEKTCHNIAVALDSNEGSPFFHKIKRLGVATQGRFNETITQATFVQALIRYISRDPMTDRDLYLRGKEPAHAEVDDLEVTIFRNMFIEGRELDIAEIIWNYFEAVARRWPRGWRATGRGFVLNKTNGFKALMRLLRPAYLYFTGPGGVVSTDDFLQLLERVNMEDEDFNIEEYKPGTSGESSMYRDLIRETGLQETR